MAPSQNLRSLPAVVLGASLLLASPGCDLADAEGSAQTSAPARQPPPAAAAAGDQNPGKPSKDTVSPQPIADGAGTWNARKAMNAKPADADQLGKLAGGQGLAPGAKAPSVMVKGTNGESVALSDLWKKGPILVVFYRGGWCPFCNFQIREFVKSQGEYEKRGVTPVFISVDSVDESKKTTATYSIPFPLLADPDLAAHRAFSVTRKADDAEVEKLKGYRIDIEKASGRKHHEMAIPSIFLIDETGTVRWSHANPDYKQRPSTEQLLGVLDARAP